MAGRTRRNIFRERASVLLEPASNVLDNGRGVAIDIEIPIVRERHVEMDLIMVKATGTNVCRSFSHEANTMSNTHKPKASADFLSFKLQSISRALLFGCEGQLISFRHGYHSTYLIKKVNLFFFGNRQNAARSGSPERAGSCRINVPVELKEKASTGESACLFEWEW